MKRSFTFLSMLLLVAMLAAACAPAATVAPTTAPQPTTPPAATQPPAATAAPTTDYSKVGPELAAAFTGKYKGTVVTMSGPFTAQDTVKFNQSVKDFQDKTGI